MPHDIRGGGAAVQDDVEARQVGRKVTMKLRIRGVMKILNFQFYSGVFKQRRRSEEHTSELQSR